MFVGLVLLCLLRRSNALLCRYVFRFDEWMMEQAGLGGEGRQNLDTSCLATWFF